MIGKMKHYGPTVAISLSLPKTEAISAALVVDYSPVAISNSKISVHYPHEYLNPEEVRWYQSLALEISRNWGIKDKRLEIDGVNLSSLIDTVDCYQHLRFFIEDFVLFRRFIESVSPAKILIDRNLSWFQRETINLIAAEYQIETDHKVLASDNIDLRAPLSIIKKALSLQPNFKGSTEFKRGEYFVLQYKRDINIFGSMLTGADPEESCLLGDSSILADTDDLLLRKIATDDFEDSSLLGPVTGILIKNKIFSVDIADYLENFDCDALLKKAILKSFPFSGKKAMPHLLVMLLKWQRICEQIPDGSVVWVSADFHPQGRAICELLKGRNVETRTIVHGMYSEQYYPVHADKIYLDGDITKDWMISKGLDKSRFVMSGSPLVDKYRGFKKIASKNGKYRVWLAVGPMSRYSNFWMVKEFVRLFNHRDDVEAAIKVHPAQSETELVNTLKYLKVDENKIRIEKRMDFKEVLENCDLLTLHSSTTAMEAMLAGVCIGMIRAGIEKPVHVMAPLLDTDVLPDDPNFDIGDWINNAERQKRQLEFGKKYLGFSYRG